MSDKRKMVWVSRHALTTAQLKDAEATFGEIYNIDAPVIMENVTWQATSDMNDDLGANVMEWNRLAALVGKFGIIAGVFPPVAMEALTDLCLPVTVASPVSRQNRVTRLNGDVSIEFEHVRWATVVI